MSEITPPSLIDRLELAGQGNLPSEDVQKLFWDAVNDDGDLSDHIYSALKEATWRLVTTRADLLEMSHWYNAARFAAANMKRRGALELSGGLRALADLMSRSHKFQEIQPVDEVLGRPRVQRILHFLTRDTETSLADLAKELSEEPASLARVTLILAANGLVARREVGREPRFSITDAGRAGLARHTSLADA